MAESEYTIESVESAPFAQISYVVWRVGGGEAIVVDPGFDPAAIRDVLMRHGLTGAAILLTHGHSDHIAGVADLKRAFPEAPLIVGRNEAPLLADPILNLSAKFGMPLVSPAADRLVDDGERLDVAGFTFLVREIPGHSPGSVVYIAEAERSPFVLAGDVLFSGSVGRTDFPGGSAYQLYSGIRIKLFSLADGTLVLPGHGPPTTIGAERRNNPIVGEKAGPYGM